VPKVLLNAQARAEQQVARFRVILLQSMPFLQTVQLVWVV
jgi:hypothetical protein